MFTDFVDTMRRGDTHLMQFVVNIAGVAQDITTYAKFWFTAKSVVTDADVAAIFQKTDGGGGIVRTTPAVGLCTVTIAPANTAILSEKPYLLLCDFQGKDASGNIWTLASGTLIVYPQVTIATV